MRTHEAVGRTTEEAITAGLEYLGLTIGDVRVDILEEGSKGLFGFFGSKQAKVRLTVKDEDEGTSTRELFSASLDEQPPQQQKKQKQKQPEKQIEKKVEAVVEQPAPKPEQKEKPQRAPRAAKPEKRAEPAAPREPAKPVTPAEQVDRQTPAGRAQEFLQTLTQLMNAPVSVAVSTDEEGNVRVNMEGDTLGILIGRRGETLDALQYLTSLQVNKGRDEYTRVTLDTEGYRAKREESLIRLANRMANRAQKTGRRVSMEPMNPYERRILHSALQNHPAVTTHSEGDEPNRHVVITLK